MKFRCKLCYFKQAMADWDIEICKDCWKEMYDGLMILERIKNA